MNHEHYPAGDYEDVRTTEDFIEFGKKSLPLYTQDYWEEACETMDPERLNGLMNILTTIKNCEYEQAVEDIKKDWIEDGVVMGSVATYLPEGVKVIRQVYREVWGDDRSKDSDAFLDKMQRWHIKQGGLLHDFYPTDICDYLLDKIESKEFSHLMDPIIEKLDFDKVSSINETFDFLGKISSNEETARFLADAMNIRVPAIKRFIVPDKEKNHYPDGMFDFKEYTISFFIPEQKQYTDYDDDKTFLNSIRQIAHEMWHAYQDEVLKKTERSKLYNEKHNYTIEEVHESHEKRFAYMKTPLETEAYVFGDMFSIKFARLLRGQLEKEYQNALEEANAGVRDDPGVVDGPWVTKRVGRARNRLTYTDHFLDRYTARAMDYMDICGSSL